MPGCPDPAVLADRAAGDGDRYNGVGDDELIGVLSAWDRLKAHMAARKLAAAAELIRRRPEPGCPPEGAARLPGGWEEFTAEELGYALAGHRGRAADLLTLAAALAGGCPAPGRRCGTGSSGWTRRGSSPPPPRCWTPVRPGRRRRWCWAGPDCRGGGSPGGGPGPAGPDGPAGPPAGGPAASAAPAGFAGRINLTIPLATLLGLADRPAGIGGIGPIDPDPEANTLDRYQTRASADPVIQHINMPHRCP